MPGGTQHHREKCPDCGSRNVHIDQRGYDSGCGCCGCALFGLPGLLAGLVGSDRLQATCLDCGNEWNPVGPAHTAGGSDDADTAVGCVIMLFIVGLLIYVVSLLAG